MNIRTGIDLAEGKRERERDALGQQPTHVFDVGSARARGREIGRHTYQVNYTGLISPTARLHLYEQIYKAAGNRTLLEIGYRAIWFSDPSTDDSYAGPKQTLERLAYGTVGVWVSPPEKYQKALIRAQNLGKYGIVRIVFPLELLDAALAFCELQRRH